MFMRSLLFLVGPMVPNCTKECSCQRTIDGAFISETRLVYKILRGRNVCRLLRMGRLRIMTTTYSQTRSANGLAIAALVCGLVGIFVLNVILGPLAMIFGSVAWSRANRGAQN